MNTAPANPSTVAINRGAGDFLLKISMTDPMANMANGTRVMWPAVGSLLASTIPATKIRPQPSIIMAQGDTLPANSFNVAYKESATTPNRASRPIQGYGCSIG